MIYRSEARYDLWSHNHFRVLDLICYKLLKKYKNYYILLTKILSEWYNFTVLLGEKENIYTGQGRVFFSGFMFR